VAANIDKEKLTQADAIEVYNSRLLTGRANRRAQKFARLHGMPMTAGSDAHISEMVGQAPTQIDANSEAIADILDAIREGKTSFEGKRTPWRISFRQAAGGMKRRVRKRMSQFFK
ncbi:MAG: PHP-associated domain-containing protein, partial [Halobacteriaceae archaeon]